MDFGEYLKEQRQTMGWTQPDAASQISIEQSYLSKLETGKAYPSDEVFCRLLATYNLEVEDVLNALSFEDVKRLSHIESVKRALTHQGKKDKSGARRWFVSGVCALAVGGALMGLTQLDTRGTFTEYSYQSQGVVLPGESLDVFAGLDERSDPAAETDLHDTKRDELMSRLDNQTQFIAEFKGATFVADVADGKRVWRLVGGTEKQSPRRYQWAIVPGLMLILGGLGCFFVSWRWPYSSPLRVSKP